jgi:hypothetical protein
VPLAIWAFRQLPAGQTHALIATAAQPLATPTALLDDLEQHLGEFAQVGMAGMNSALRDRWLRLEKRLRAAELIWLAEILLDLQQSSDYYQQHDAQFDIDHVIDCLGELWIRSDAIRHHDRVNNPVPQLLIRGSAQDQTVKLGAARLVGLGCGVMPRSTGVTLTAYLQDVDTGTVVAIPRYFADPTSKARPNPTANLAAHSTPKAFWQLAQSSVGKGLQLRAVGAGQVLLKGGKRTPSYQLLPGRSPISLNPQSYQWEKLRSPLRVDAFAELTDRLQALPPPELRPRRVTERLQVLPIAAVRSVEFDRTTQTVQAIVTDASGTPATLIHPYSHRGRFGVEALLQQLAAAATSATALKFVSAQVSLSHQGLTLEPIALVWQTGPTRQMLQPWIAAPSGDSATALPMAATTNQTMQISTPTAITAYRQDLTTALQDLWLVGLDRANRQHLQQWQRLVQQGEAIGFSQLLHPIAQFTTALADKFHTLHWDSQPARESLAIITVLHQLTYRF